jgi:hypothetical protein
MTFRILALQVKGRHTLIDRPNEHKAISHPGIRLKHCAYGHKAATLVNPRGVTRDSNKYLYLYLTALRSLKNLDLCRLQQIQSNNCRIC